MSESLVDAVKMRLRGWGLVDLTSILTIVVYGVYLTFEFDSGHWLVNARGGLGQTDFAEFWAAGRVAATGHGAHAYQWAMMRPLLGSAAAPLATTPFPFFYPPIFLAPLWLVSLFPPAVAAGVWVVSGLGAYLLAAWKILPRASAPLLAAASPAVLCCLSIGQNGLFTAACFAGGLVLLDRRPIVAGLLIGLLSCKPQLGIFVPIALIVSGRWRTVFSASVSVIALVAISLTFFGWSAWAEFIKVNSNAQGLCDLLVHRGQSLYDLLRLCGVSQGGAWAAQAITALACLLFVGLHWRSRQPMGFKAAGLIAATVLATPYSFLYDFPITALAMLFILSAQARATPSLMDRVTLFLSMALPFALLSPAITAVGVVSVVFSSKHRSLNTTLATVIALAVAVPLLTVFPVFCVGAVIGFLLVALVMRHWLFRTGADLIHERALSETSSVTPKWVLNPQP